MRDRGLRARAAGTSRGAPVAHGEPPATEAQSDRQRRAVRVLVASQVLGGVGVASGISAGALAAEEVSGSTSLAGLAQTGAVLGAALLALPLARLAARTERRHALAGGYLVGLAGALVTVVALVIGVFWLMVLGSVLFGGATASNLQARYAATDSATGAARGRALSVVVWATTVGAVAGPNLMGPGASVAATLGLPPLAGPYLFAVASFLGGATVVLALLRVKGAPVRREVRAPAGPRLRAVLATVWRLPRARLALVAIATAHAVMVGVMVMTPVHLGHGGASLEVVGVVISLHVAGMYAASPVFGWLTDKIGRVTTVAVGIGILVLALVVGATSPGSSGVVGHADHAGYATQPVQVGVALTLLGLGWSCCVVAGSTLLSESVPGDVRIPAQGASDLVMGIAAAAAGVLAGPVLAASGYGRLSLLASVLLLPVGLLGVRLLMSARRPPSPHEVPTASA